MPRQTSVLEQLRQHQEGSTAPPAERLAEQGLARVGSYARISDAYEDAETGVTEDGVKRQLRANRHIAEARGWQVADEYVDNDVSAFREGVVRDRFEALLADLEAGVIDGVICYNLDRFARKVVDLERAIALYDSARRLSRPMYFATAEGDLNLASDDGLTMARVMVAFANKSSRDTARRVKAKRAEQRDNAQTVSAFRPFGWRYTGSGRDRRYVIDQAEADAVRWAADGLIAGGVSWVRVAAEWNARGLLTPRNKQWTAATVKQVLTSPRLAGWLMHDGSIAVHSETGRLVRSTLPAILDDTELEALLQATNRPARAVTGRRRYLLSGIVRCAECGAGLGGSPPQTEGGAWSYHCRPGAGMVPTAGGPACGKVHVNGRELDSMIEELVLPRIVEGTSGAKHEEDWPGEAELLALQTQKDQLLADFRAERATSELVFPAVTSIEQRMEAMRADRAAWTRERRRDARGAGVTAEGWPSLDLDERRELVAAQIEAVYVKAPTRPRARTFEPGRVLPPVWRVPA